MKFRDLFYETWQALAANRGRSFLTILGIIIGISSVIAMTSLIGGIKNSLISDLGLNQARVVYLNIWDVGRDVTFEDLEQFSASLPLYEDITGAVSGSGTLSSAEKSVGVGVVGVKPVYFDMQGTKLAQGRFFTDAEERGGAMSVIINQNTVRAFFGSADAEVVGRTITLDGTDYNIIGVAEASESTYSNYETVYLPYATACGRIVGANAPIAQIIGFAYEGVDMVALEGQTRDFLIAYFNLDPTTAKDHLYVASLKSEINEFESVMTAFQAIAAAVAGISLFVGGIGIMNMMLTNVTERIREIGLRKALGARRRDITQQFLLEAIMLCVMGGVFGIAFGYVVSWGMAAVVSAVRDMSFAPAISLPAILFAVAVCVGIGLIFGYYPAKRAAKMDPVESLRYQ